MLSTTEKIVISAVICTLGFLLSTKKFRSIFCEIYHDPHRCRWGASDPFRVAFFNSDGEIRRTPMLLFYAALLAFVWLGN